MPACGVRAVSRLPSVASEGAPGGEGWATPTAGVGAAADGLRQAQRRAVTWG